MKLMLNGKEVSGMGHYVMAGDIKDATAEDSNVLSGKAYYNNNGKREGTMPNRGGMSAELAAGGSVSIPEGYHNGEGVVRAQDLASQTAGTAAAANIEAGYTAWVNGEMVEGNYTPPTLPTKGLQFLGELTLPSSSMLSIPYPLEDGGVIEVESGLGVRTLIPYHRRMSNGTNDRFIASISGCFNYTNYGYHMEMYHNGSSFYAQLKSGNLAEDWDSTRIKSVKIYKEVNY